MGECSRIEFIKSERNKKKLYDFHQKKIYQNSLASFNIISWLLCLLSVPPLKNSHTKKKKNNMGTWHGTKKRQKKLYMNIEWYCDDDDDNIF